MAVSVQDKINADLQVAQMIVNVQTQAANLYAQTEQTGSLVDAVNLNLSQALTKGLAQLKSILP